MQQAWGSESRRFQRPMPWRAASACECRECRKESRSLLAAATAVKRGEGQATLPLGVTELMKQQSANFQEAMTADAALATSTDFVGGECCVTLSVEYAATVATAGFMVVVLAVDSEGTILAWARVEKAGTPYRVHECIITTKPGTKLTLVAVNCSARLRWCEVFSC